MATATQDDIEVTDAWLDLVTSNASLASVDVLIQNKSASGEFVYVVFGGSSPGANSYKGHRLGRDDSITGNAAAIWVRAPNGGAADDLVGVSLL